jgi:regulatory protein
MRRRVATLTGLRRSSPGRVQLEVDGLPWITVPDEVVVRCGLSGGVALERPLLRKLRRELRRAEARAAAARAVTARDISRQRLGERLRARGIAPEPGAEAVAELVRAGIVDDERLARARAGALAERGWANAAIEARLEREKIATRIVRQALAELPSERERAGQLVRGVPDRRAAWKLLGRRGYAPETIEDVVGGLDEEA